MSESSDEALPSTDPEERTARLILGLVVLAWVGLSLPLLSGEKTLFERDVFSIHLHQKYFGAQELKTGSIPYFRPDLGLGQNFRSNPNALPLYPGNVLYLVLPFWTAFNLHYLLHWLLALFAMRALARALGASHLAALLAGVTYAASGFIFSSLTFYNLLTVAAWWPLVMAGVLTGTRRGVAIAGGACGLAIYGGEPFTLLIGTMPLLALAVQRFGALGGVLRSACAGVLGLLLAAPQVVSVLRTVSFTSRKALGAADANLFVFHPLRLLELLIPQPFGVSADIGADRYLLGRLGEQEPFFYTVHFGVVALPLLAVVAHRRPALSLLSGLGLLLAIFGASLEKPLEILSFGLFRYPEKFLFLPALLVPLLAAYGLDRTSAATRNLAWAFAAVAGALLPMAWFGGEALTQWLASGLLSQELEVIGTRRAHAAAVSLGVSAVFLLAAGWLAQRQHRVGLVLLQLVAVARLLAVIEVDSLETYSEEPAWRSILPSEARVVSSTYEPIFGESPPTYFSDQTSKRLFLDIAHADLDFQTGVLSGLQYPIVPDFDGLASPLQLLVEKNLPRIPWPSRINWLRTFGVNAIVTVDITVPTSLRALARTSRHGVLTQLLEVPNPAPDVWWPQSVNGNGNPIEAFEWVSRATDPVRSITVGGAVAAQGRGSVELVEVTADRIVLDVESDGGTVAVRRAYNPLWRASSETATSLIKVVNLALLGVEVPAGSHRITLAVDKRPDRIAQAVALFTLLGAFFLFIRNESDPPQ